jgi:hypothetical protein
VSGERLGFLGVAAFFGESPSLRFQTLIPGSLEKIQTTIGYPDEASPEGRAQGLEWHAQGSRR